MEHAAMILVMILPALIASVVTAMNAKKLNAAWHDRRVARLSRAAARL